MQKVLISSALAGAVWSKKASLDNLGDVNGRPNLDDTTSADFTENDKAHFLEWTATHGKHYTDAQEFEKRQRNWFDTELEIRRKGNSTFKLAHNKFSDWSTAEKDAILTLRTPFDQPASSPPIANRKRTNVTISCATGEYVFYNRNTGADECRSCDYGCDECIDSRTCLKCSSSTMQVSKLGKCQCDGRNMFLNGNTGDCEECPAGTGLYRRFNICVPCGANCSECKTWNKCGTCEPGFTFTLGQCYADLCSRDDLLMNADGECVCKRGYHDTGSVCVYCPQGQAWDSASESCTDDEGKKCDGGAVWDPIWEECSCPEGSSFSNQKCVPDEDSWDQCPNNCDNCDSSNKCTTCTDTYWYNDVNNTCYCPDNHFVTNENKCIPTEECESDQFRGTNNVCLDCPDNCVACNDGTGECTQCATGFEPHGSENSCVCPEGLRQDNTTCVPYQDCPAGQFSNETNGDCTPCPGANCALCANGAGKCTSCTDPSWFFTANGMDCQETDECPYPLGPYDGDMTDCYDSMYDSNRIVPPFAATATSVDWRTKNVITPVKDQGGCGSCWAFMATHPFEAAIAIQTGVLYRISQQQLVDCDRVSNAGCNGGWPTDSWEYYYTKGAVLDEDYPYTGRDESCKDANLEKVARTTSAAYRYVQNGDKEAMKTILRLRPISVAFSVGNAFYNYESGIFSDDGSGGICASGVNHGMTGVGFGVQNGVEYVIVKNSWGQWWGEAGYVKINISNNTCQILYWPSYPLTW